MASQDRTIVYTFKMVTNIKETTAEIKEGTDESKNALEETNNMVGSVNENIRKSTDESNAELDRTSRKAVSVNERIKTLSEESNEAIDETKTKEEELKEATDNTTMALSKQQGQLMMQVTALMAVKSAVSGVTNGLIQMGLVSEEDAAKLKMVNSGFQLVCGFATGIKALAMAQDVLNLSALKTAVVNTYNSILESPWKLAIVGAGVGAAVGIGAALMSQSGGSSSSTTTNNIIIEDSSGPQAHTATGITATISGGKVI